MRPLFLEKRTK